MTRSTEKSFYTNFLTYPHISQLVEALETQNEKALNKAIYTATQERTRYFADRIARTEMARAARWQSSSPLRLGDNEKE